MCCHANLGSNTHNFWGACNEKSKLLVEVKVGYFQEFSIG